MPVFSRSMSNPDLTWLNEHMVIGHRNVNPGGDDPLTVARVFGAKRSPHYSRSAATTTAYPRLHAPPQKSQLRCQQVTAQLSSNASIPPADAPITMILGTIGSCFTIHS